MDPTTTSGGATPTATAPSTPVAPTGAAPGITSAPVNTTPPTPPTATPVQTAPTPPATAPTAVVPPAPPAPPAVKEWNGSEDDEIDNKSIYKLSGSAFRKRIERDRRRTLLAIDEASGGDVAKLQERLKRLNDFEQQEEARRQEQMTAAEKQAEQVKAANERAEAAERRLAAIEDEKVVQKEVERVSSIAKKFVDDDDVDDVVWGPFKKYISTLSEEDVNSLDDDDISRWFEDFTKRKPKYARGATAASQTATPPAQEPAAAPPAAPTAPAAKTSVQQSNRMYVPRKQGITNGLKTNDKPSPITANPQEKTLKPGLPNSMTKEEVAAWKRERGLRY